MNPLDTEFHKRVAARLAEASTEKANTLLSGALDHLDYKRECGYLKAIADVREMCEQIESDMNQGK